MKAVLISIQPKWCELIASGKKTIEVRKTKPKLETPFKIYIYCTKAKIPIWDNGHIVMYEDDLAITNRWGQGKRVENPCGAMMEGELFLNGKVIGEFVCDVINPIYSQSVEKQALCAIAIGNGDKEYYENSCVSYKEAYRYFKNAKMGYGWHISNLIIYDKPRDLGEFYRECEEPNCDDCPNLCVKNTPDYYEIYCICDEKIPIKRPPQSWCYVESEKE